MAIPTLKDVLYEERGGVAAVTGNGPDAHPKARSSGQVSPKVGSPGGRAFRQKRKPTFR